MPIQHAMFKIVETFSKTKTGDSNICQWNILMIRTVYSVILILILQLHKE